MMPNTHQRRLHHVEYKVATIARCKSLRRRQDAKRAAKRQKSTSLNSHPSFADVCELQRLHVIAAAGDIGNHDSHYATVHQVRHLLGLGDPCRKARNEPPDYFTDEFGRWSFILAGYERRVDLFIKLERPGKVHVWVKSDPLIPAVEIDIIQEPERFLVVVANRMHALDKSNWLPEA